jgi:hypothetical protein
MAISQWENNLIPEARIDPNTPGYNPMRWCCQEKGCFNDLLRPKLEIFADCFPGKRTLGDIDGWCSIDNNWNNVAGHDILLEWKSKVCDIPLGQELSYRRLSRYKDFTIFVVAGQAKTMRVEAVQIYYSTLYKNGIRTWFKTDITDLKKRIRDWVAWAQGTAGMGQQA